MWDFWGIILSQQAWLCIFTPKHAAHSWYIYPSREDPGISANCKYLQGSVVLIALAWQTAVSFQQVGAHLDSLD